MAEAVAESLGKDLALAKSDIHAFLLAGLTVAVGPAMPDAHTAICGMLCAAGLALHRYRAASYFGLLAALLSLFNIAVFPVLSLALCLAGLIVFLGKRPGKIVLLAQVLWLLLAIIAFGSFFSHVLNVIFGTSLFDFRREGMDWLSLTALVVLCIALFFTLLSSAGGWALLRRSQVPSGTGAEMEAALRMLLSD